MEIFEKQSEILPFDYITSSSAKRRPNGYVSKERVEALLGMDAVLAEEKAFVESHYTMDRRVRTLAVRLLEKHIEFVTLMSEVFLEKAKGENEKALELFEAGRIKFGRHEPVIGKYFNHSQFFGSLKHCAQLVIDNPIFFI